MAASSRLRSRGCRVLMHRRPLGGCLLCWLLAITAAGDVEFVTQSALDEYFNFVVSYRGLASFRLDQARSPGPSKSFPVLSARPALGLCLQSSCQRFKILGQARPRTCCRFLAKNQTGGQPRMLRNFCLWPPAPNKPFWEEGPRQTCQFEKGAKKGQGGALVHGLGSRDGRAVRARLPHGTGSGGHR